MDFAFQDAGLWNLVDYVIYVRSIYHCLTSITSAFHFDKMRFVSGKLDGCVVIISDVRRVDGMTSDGSCFALCKRQFLSHLRILLYRAFLHKNLIILMERGWIVQIIINMLYLMHQASLLSLWDKSFLPVFFSWPFQCLKKHWRQKNGRWHSVYTGWAPWHTINIDHFYLLLCQPKINIRRQFTTHNALNWRVYKIWHFVTILEENI